MSLTSHGYIQLSKLESDFLIEMIEFHNTEDLVFNTDLSEEQIKKLYTKLEYNNPIDNRRKG